MISKVLTGITITPIAIALAAQAQAQSAGSGRALEEVIVQARKVAESSQSVPVSMSVLTPEKLNSINAFDFTEIDRIVPSLQLGQNSPASATLKIRNVGPDFFALAFPAAVAVYVDGIPQAQPGSVFTTMLDIERIEVLNGPQGTLYGKNAPAGLISLYTANPHMDDLDGYVKSSFSSWDTMTHSLAVNSPLIEDQLAVRVAGLYSESDGYFDNAVKGVTESNGKEHKAVRTKLLWQPADELEVLFTYYYADIFTEDNDTGYEGQVPDDQGLTDFTSEYDRYEVFKGIPSYSDTKDQSFGLNVAWDLDVTNLTFLAQYQDLDIFQQQDNSDWRVIPPPEVPRDFLEFNPVAWSTEMRADGELFDNFTYVGGIIYSEDDTDTINSIGGVNVIGGSTTETWGVYTNWTWRFTEQWETSLGARYSDVTYDADVFGFIPGVGELDSPYKETYSDPSYSFKLRYYPQDDLMLYAAVDTAFRSGGVNVLAPLAGQLADIFTFDPVQSNLLTINQDYLEFTQEDSIAYELGMKGTFLDQRLRWNVSVFLQEYDDHQYRTSPSDSSVTPALSGALSNLAVNVEEVEVYGFESEFDYLINDVWSLSVVAAYAKPEIQEYSKRMCEEGEASPGTLICPGEEGEQLNGEPTFHTLAQLQFSSPWQGQGFGLFGNITAEYYNKPNQVVSTPNIDDLLTFDATLGVRDLDSKWSVSVWGKNITDETDFLSEEVSVEMVSPGVEEIIGYSAPLRAPRSIGITGEYYF